MVDFLPGILGGASFGSQGPQYASRLDKLSRCLVGRFLQAHEGYLKGWAIRV